MCTTGVARLCEYTEKDLEGRLGQACSTLEGLGATEPVQWLLVILVIRRLREGEREPLDWEAPFP